MNLRFLTLFFTAIFVQLGYGQSVKLDNNHLEELAQKMVNDSLIEGRVEANDELKSTLITQLQNPKSQKNSYSELTAVAVTESKDDRFRIFSWQLYINPDEYRHEGIIQFMDAENSLLVLNDESDNIRFPDRKELDPNKRFGALYYNIIPFKLKGKMKYLLFGFDSATRTENCKIVDVLNIDKKGKLTFGAPLFVSEKQGIKQESYRYFHQYDQNAKAILNYDVDQEIIIFDHLIPWTSKEIGVGLTYVPDGSYEGFELKKGSWKHIEKVFDYKSEVPVGADNPFGKKVE